MKKLVYVSLIAAAITTATVSSLRNNSSIPENPLLAANVEALSSAEFPISDIVEVNGNTISILNAANIIDSKGRSLNDCENKSGSICNIVVKSSSSKGSWFSNLTQMLSSEHFSSLVSTILNFLAMFK